MKRCMVAVRLGLRLSGKVTGTQRIVPGCAKVLYKLVERKHTDMCERAMNVPAKLIASGSPSN